jgi:hypothetical protein
MNLERCRDPRLADARLARDQYHPLGGLCQVHLLGTSRGCILGRVCHGIPTAMARACSGLGHIDLFHEYAGAPEVAGGDDNVKIRCGHQSTDQAAAKNARSSDDQDGTCHGCSPDGSSSAKRAAIAEVGTRQLSFRPNRRYRLRAILS